MLSNNNWFKYILCWNEWLLLVLFEVNVSLFLLFSDLDEIKFLFTLIDQYSKSSWGNNGLNLIATFIEEIFAGTTLVLL